MASKTMTHFSHVDILSMYFGCSKVEAAEMLRNLSPEERDKMIKDAMKELGLD